MHWSLHPFTGCPIYLPTLSQSVRENVTIKSPFPLNEGVNMGLISPIHHRVTKRRYGPIFSHLGTILPTLSQSVWENAMASPPLHRVYERSPRTSQSISDNAVVSPPLDRVSKRSPHSVTKCSRECHSKIILPSQRGSQHGTNIPTPSQSYQEKVRSHFQSSRDYYPHSTTQCLGEFTTPF